MIRFLNTAALAAALITSAPSLAQSPFEAIGAADDNPSVLFDGQANGTATNDGIQPSFDLLPGSGPSNVASSLTVNGTNMTTLADYDARDISGTTWPARAGVAGTLNETSGGGSPTSGQTAPFTEAGARSVKYVHSKFHDGADAGIGTDDYVIELVAQINDQGSTTDVLSDGDNNNTGFELQPLAGGTFRFIHGDGTTVNTATSYTSGAWYHVMIFADRSANARLYMNGAFTSSVSIAARTGSISAPTNGFEIGGAAQNPGAETTSAVVSARTWKCTGCLNTTAEMDSIAAERNARVWGVFSTPTPTFARATTTVCDIDRDADGVRRLFTLAAGAPCVEKRKNSSAVIQTGYRGQPGITNLLLQSETFDNASWTKVNGAITANTIADSFGATTADAYESTDAAGNVAHCITQAPTLSVTTNTESVWFRTDTAITKAYIGDATIANGLAWFNLATCTTLSKQAGVTQFSAENYGASLCRVQASFLGTAAAHTIDICGATADLTTTYDDGSNATVDWVAVGAQLEQNSGATSYIATTTATATRNEDVLSYAVTQAMPLTIEVSYLCPSYDTLLSGGLIEHVLDGNNAITMFQGDVSDRIETTGYIGASFQFTINGTTDTSDNNTHTIRTVAAANNAQSWLDGTSLGTDVTVTTFTPTSLHVGHGTTLAGANRDSGCMITRVREWPTLVVQ